MFGAVFFIFKSLLGIENKGNSKTIIILTGSLESILHDLRQQVKLLSLSKPGPPVFPFWSRRQRAYT